MSAAAMEVRHSALCDMFCLIVQAELRELREQLRQITESKNTVSRLNTLPLNNRG